MVCLELQWTYKNKVPYLNFPRIVSNAKKFCHLLWEIFCHLCRVHYTISKVTWFLVRSYQSQLSCLFVFNHKFAYWLISFNVTWKKIKKHLKKKETFQMNFCCVFKKSHQIDINIRWLFLVFLGFWVQNLKIRGKAIESWCLFRLNFKRRGLQM